MITMCLFSLSLLAPLVNAQSNVINLAGQWRFLMNGPKPGDTQQELPKLEFIDNILLPGTTETNKKGPESTYRWNGGLTRLYRFEGPAWYECDITIPEAWRGKRVTLFLERTKYTQVWLDGKMYGENPILCTPQEYVFGVVEPGSHRITIVVDNIRKPVKSDMHQTSENTQTNWNGIIGRLELRATDAVWLDDVQVYSNVEKKSVTVKGNLGNIIGEAGKGKVMFTVRQIQRENTPVPNPVATEVSWSSDGGVFETEIPMGENVQLWDEFKPAIYELTVLLDGGDNIKDSKVLTFGMRKFNTKGSQFAINNRITFLRGKHDACVFPLTGYPPMDVEGWLKYLGICQEYGINYIRCHTWIPPEAAFLAADQLGIYLQPELPYWGDYGLTEKKALMPEAKNIMKYFGNHPSFVMFSLGNECRGSREIMGEMIKELRTLDSRHLYAQGSNNFAWEARLSEGDDFWISINVRNSPDNPVNSVRGSQATMDSGGGHVQIGPPNTMKDYSQAIAGIPVPVIGHEVGQYTVYPNFHEIEKYTGVVRARNFEQFREKLDTAGMLDQADDFFRASGKLSAICYREEIEAALRTPGFGGFNLLDLQDFPGQGTALVGMLDTFMDSKGLITPEQWRQFCSPIVLLAKFEKYTWTAGEFFKADIEVAHYGAEDLQNTVLVWTIRDGQGKDVAYGSFPAQTIKQGGVRSLGKISTTLGSSPKPSNLTLELKLKGTQIATSYPLWVYPEKITTDVPKSVKLVRTFNAEARQTLANGGTVLLIPDVKRGFARTVGGGFTTDFWCWPMFHNKPGTMGILCDPKHPALGNFLTDFYSNWQWFHIVINSQPVILDTLGKGFHPIVQVIDNLDRVHKLGLIFEAKVSSGRLLVCASDLLSLSDKPEACQLLSSLLSYAESEQFAPKNEVTMEILNDILISAGPTKGKVTGSPDGRGVDWRPTGPAQAFDGIEQTRWFIGEMWWKVEFDEPSDISGAEIIWSTDKQGYQYILEGSTDGSNWATLSDQRENKFSGVHRLDFNAKGLRFVRIKITGFPPDCEVGIREVRFFGVD